MNKSALLAKCLGFTLLLYTSHVFGQDTIDNSEFWPKSVENSVEKISSDPDTQDSVEAVYPLDKDEQEAKSVKNAENVIYESEENPADGRMQVQLRPDPLSIDDESSKNLEEIALSDPKIVAIDMDAIQNENKSQSAKDYIADRFRFSSYGRVQPSINPATGESGRQTRLVYPNPRVDEASYLELSLDYTPYRSNDGVEVDVMTTIAFGGEKLFHFDSDFEAKVAVRNLYVEARNLFFTGTVLWAGSRMYRGDDIYLLDFWPLDNLNTYGGGVGYRAKSRSNIDLHFGVNRLNNDYQYQVVDVINERFVGEQEVVFLDRQRFIGSLKFEQLLGGEEIPLFKLKAYAEFHTLAKGKLLLKQPEIEKDLPNDSGWLLGLQFGVSHFYRDSFVNLFVKYASGLAAYGEHAIPFGVNNDMRAKNAKQFLLGLSAGLDTPYFGAIFGGYLRHFKDADANVQDYDDGWEGVWDLRLSGFIGKYFSPSVEFSQQLRRANDVNPVSLKQELAQIFKISILPAVRFGDGLLTRPEIRLNYSVSFLNDAAKNTFAPRDRLRNRSIEHFLGFAAEWWF